MKAAKRIMFILVMVLVLSTSAIPAMAHGSSHKAKTTYSQCTKKNCSKTSVHTHNGKKYCGHKKAKSGHKSSIGSKDCH
jgi:hypothetical protein